ncbi:MAG: hypothetical protein ACOC32_00185 [Nanoarchaeota archaeon]
MGLIADEVGIIKFKGTFDLQGMLRMMHAYIVDRGYDFFETTHKAKVPELELKWKGEKKVTPYERYDIKLEFHFYDLKQIEVDGRKMTEGRFTIVFDGDVKRDFQGVWDTKKSKVQAKLKTFYETVTKKEWMVKHAGTLIGEVAELRDKTNSYLGMVAAY